MESADQPNSLDTELKEVASMEENKLESIGALTVTQIESNEVRSDHYKYLQQAGKIPQPSQTDGPAKKVVWRKRPQANSRLPNYGRTKKATNAVTSLLEITKCFQNCCTSPDCQENNPTSGSQQPQAAQSPPESDPIPVVSKLQSEKSNIRCYKKFPDPDPIMSIILEVCCIICRESEGEKCCKTNCCDVVCCIGESLRKKKQAQSNPKPSKNRVHAEFAIEGLTCSDCSLSLEKHLAKCTGIISAAVNDFSNIAKIVYDPALISERDIPQEIKKLGFGATPRLISEAGVGRVQLSMARPWKEEDSTIIEKLKGVLGVIEVRVQSDLLRPLITIQYHPTITGPRTLLQTLDTLGLKTTLFVPKTKDLGAQSARAIAVKYRNALLLSLLFSIPVAIIAFLLPLSPVAQSGLRINLVGSFTLRALLEWILSTPIQFWIALPLYNSAFRSLRFTRKANMDTLVMLSTTTAYVYSAISSIISMANSSYEGVSFFETSAILLTLIMLGRYLEISAKNRTSQTLSKLLQLQPETATLLLKGNETEEIDVNLLQMGDLVQVVPGAKLPTDGIIAYGISSIDESAITGESIPSVKQLGDTVYGGSVNQDGVVHVRVTKTAQESTVAAMVQLVEKAQASKAPISSLGDTIASYFVPFILVLSTAVFFLWLGLALSGKVPAEHGAFPFALQFFLSLLVIACPCALALAAPTPIVVGIGVGAKLGILYKGGGQAFSHCNKADTIVLDKTGTLTWGRPRVVFMEKVENVMDDTLLFLVGSAEAQSEHPVAKAIYVFCRDGLERKFVNPMEFKAFPGRGLKCIVAGQELVIGNISWLKDNGKAFCEDELTVKEISLKKKVRKGIEEQEGMGRTVVCVAINKKMTAYLGLMDTPREEAYEVIERLRQMKMDIWMLSGDNQKTANTIAASLGIPHAVGNLLPSQKQDKIREFQQAGKVVVMVGDGINDSPALCQADVGIAVGSGTDVAIEAANIVLMKPDLMGVIHAIHLAKMTFRCIYANFAWAFLFNVVGILTAAGAFFPVGSFVIPPPLAGLAELVSSLPVILFSLLLYLYRPYERKLRDLP